MWPFFTLYSNRNINDSNGGPDWHKYFLCGVKGILEIIPRENIPTGMFAAVWGNVPTNSGLSSSSALVSAAALSTVQVCQVILFLFVIFIPQVMVI